MISDLEQRLAAVATPLPSGRLVRHSEGVGAPAYWLTDGKTTVEEWLGWHRAAPTTGLQPLLVDEGDGGPWSDGHMWPRDGFVPGGLDAAALMADWWADHTEADEDDVLDPDERADVTAPFVAWPGLAPADPPSPDAADDMAAQYAEHLLADGGWRLALVAADRPADVPDGIGWPGFANYAGPVGELSAVLRSWEDRFGARLVAAGFDTLRLSVAAPPLSAEHALRVAAEHFALCPDNVWQGNVETLAEYAAELEDLNMWTFWWD